MNLKSAERAFADDGSMEMSGVRHDGLSDDAAQAATVGLASFVAEHYDRLISLAWLVCRDASDAAEAVRRVVIAARSYAGSSTELKTELQHVLDSIVFDAP